MEEMTGYELPLSEAIALAQRESWRQRVLAYISRRAGEILVFEHSAEYPEAGIQVPAGGVDPGETPAEAVVRETEEEAGLVLQNPVHLASYHWTRGEKSQVWHYFWLKAAPDTPDQWSHQVSSGSDDAGMIFFHRFVPVDQHGLIAGHRYEEALPVLKSQEQEAF